ncbi:MAG: DUF2088 domain-containing protein [Deltaproteobacteria bacterium]|nr:DUF2088 domain-containing protein [Deltaproteobacteria bacterium]
MRFAALKLPGWTWAEEKIEIYLPQDWQVTIYPMKGWSAPKIPPSKMIAALRNPLGTPPLKELIKGRKEVAIIFDDLSRPTRVEEIALQLIEELLNAGIKEEGIRFVVALGAHAPHNYAILGVS